jgi:hypothetical protein
MMFLLLFLLISSALHAMEDNGFSEYVFEEPLTIESLYRPGDPDLDWIDNLTFELIPERKPDTDEEPEVKKIKRTRAPQIKMSCKERMRVVRQRIAHLRSLPQPILILPAIARSLFNPQVTNGSRQFSCPVCLYRITANNQHRDQSRSQLQRHFEKSKRHKINPEQSLSSQLLKDLVLPLYDAMIQERTFEKAPEGYDDDDE